MRKIITTGTQETDPLFVLIKSLSRSEKRQFKLYVGRLEGNQNAKFIQLFDLLDKAKRYDENVVLSSGIVTKVQLSNLKAHLYRQLLTSLRLNPARKDIRVQLREQLDFATILYHKGLYKQSLRMLDKAKTIALDNDEKNIAYEIVELEKIIETQYITNSMTTRASELSAQARKLSKANVITSRLSNLSLELYGMMLRMGYVRSDLEKKEVETYFNSQIPNCVFEELDFREKLWLTKAHLWYSFLTQDFVSCYKFSERWVRLFEDNPSMITINPVFYLKGLHYLLESLYYLKKEKQFKAVLTKLESLRAAPIFEKQQNLQTLLFLYINSNKFNHRFMIGDYSEAESLISEVLEGIKSPKYRINSHHVLVYYYKLASLSFGQGKFQDCIDYLSKVINSKTVKTREDLMCFSRLLNLIAHYEAGKDYHLESLLRSTFKFLIKMNDLHGVQKAIISFMKNLGNIYPSQLKSEFEKLHTILKRYENDPYERRAFLYLDALSWLESKIENKPVAIIIEEKAKKLVRD